MSIWFIVLLMVLWASPGFAASTFPAPLSAFTGYVKVRPDRELYVEAVKAQPGRPTVLLLNGLTFTTREYRPYALALIRRGIGVISFDFDGMGLSLLRYTPSVAAYPVEQQIKDARAILIAMGQRPPFNLVGLSYGGGVAQGFALAYPREVGKIVLIAPFTESLDNQDQWIRRQIAITRRTFPGNPATDDELFDFFLHQLVYSTYPQSEPIVLENPFKLEGIYNLVRGIRRFRPIDSASRLPAGTIHLMVAGSDQYIPAKMLTEFWRRVNPAARMSRVLVYQSEHKMPQFVPEFTAAWTWQILKGNPILSGGRDFEAWPFAMLVKRGSRQIPLED